MHMTATLTKWYEEHGKHEIFAGGKSVPLMSRDHAMVLREDIVTNDIQHDLDNLGIAKTAREEKTRARDAKLKQDAENARMARLYREHILQEKPQPGLVTIESLAPAPKPAAQPAVKPVEEREEVGSFGD
jgi:hypothetical protein